MTRRVGPWYANIGAAGIRRRRLGGVVWLLLGAAAALVLRARAAGALAYVMLVVPYSMGALGLLQAREKT